MRSRGLTGDGHLDAGQVADGRRHDLGAQRIDPAALGREGDDGDGLVGADLDAGGLGQYARG
jgi:hypothetical protein